MDSRPEYKHAELTEQIIRAFYTVYNTLGYGFLEKVYVKALLAKEARVDCGQRSRYRRSLCW